MRITRVFFDVNMGLGFDGLNKILKKSKTKLDADATIFFLNRRMNKFKLFRGQEFLVYYRHKSRIPLNALILLPSAFGGSQTEMDQAIRKSLMSKLGLE